jgi:hypothetical protein
MIVEDLLLFSLFPEINISFNLNTVTNDFYICSPYENMLLKGTLL